MVCYSPAYDGSQSECRHRIPQPIRVTAIAMTFTAVAAMAVPIAPLVVPSPKIVVVFPAPVSILNLKYIGGRLWGAGNEDWSS